MARSAAGWADLAGFVRRAAPEFFRRMSADAKRPVVPAPGSPQFSSWKRAGVHLTWIGHSTIVLSIDGFVIITDPVFSTRIGIGLGPFTLGLKRLVAPAAPIHDLPKPDLILLSHAHMDHWDIPSLRKLEDSGTAVVTAANTSDLLRVRRYRAVHELRWNETVRLGPASIRAFEVNHWGARMRKDTHRSYNGYLIESGRYRIVFGGDTAFTDTFRQLRSSQRIDFAIMPIGAYDPWIYAHCTPEQALAMANQAGAELVVPVHHRTFQLSREPLHEPMERLLEAAGSASDRIRVRDFGEELEL